MLRRIGSKHPQNEEIENSDLQYLRGYILTKLDNTLMAGNPDINLNKGDIEAKFCYTQKCRREIWSWNWEPRPESC